MTSSSRPAFEDLPTDEPYKNAWGVHGTDDELGTLNLLTPEVVKRATQEVKHGITIGLNLPLDTRPNAPFNPTRCALTQKINAKGYANDDELHFNTQASSQWDGLRHFPYQKSLQFYNGATQNDITGPNATGKLGTHHMAKKGIVGRGVLLDFRSWAVKNGIKYDGLDTFRITTEHLDAVAKDQGVTFLPGDILIIRSGLTEAYNALSPERQLEMGGGKHMAFPGVDQSEAMLKWHWDHQFAAVAGDTYAYEAWPPLDTPADGKMKVKFCHEVFLAGWGMPIGELFDLEELAATCKRLGQYQFAIAASPLHVVGGVASTANTVAIL